MLQKLGLLKINVYTLRNNYETTGSDIFSNLTEKSYNIKHQ